MQSDQVVEDSTRLRNRLIRLFELIGNPDSSHICKVIECELGVEVESLYGDVDWGKFAKLPMRDFLDTVTLCRAFAGKAGKPPLSDLISTFNRIFSEERSAYLVDDKLGVHPSVDPAFRANLESVMRGLNGLDFQAARNYLEKADAALLPQNDRREAVKAIFDAVENVFKQTFTGTTHINTATIQSSLKPAVETLYTDGIEKRTALKQVESMRDWVDGCHNYRHEPGQPEPIAPSEELAVLLVSNGISFTRWIVDIRSRLNN